MRDDPAVASLVARLQDGERRSSAQWWPQYDVAAFETHRRVFNHPRAGRLEFETEQLVPVAAPDVRVVVHLPVDGDDSASAARRGGAVTPSESGEQRLAERDAAAGSVRRRAP